MRTIAFDDEEVDVLLTIMENYLPQLEREISHTDRPEFQRALSRRDEVVHSLLSKLKVERQGV